MGPKSDVRRDPVRLLTLFVLLAAALALSFCPHGEITGNRYLPFYHMQAESLLKGHVYLDFPDGRWAQDAIPFQGHNYLAIGPLNAFLLLPFFAVFGQAFSERIFCFLFFALYLVVGHLFLTRPGTRFTRAQYALWLAFLAFGTDLITCQVIGTAWFSAALVGSFLVAAGAYALLQSRRLRDDVLGIGLMALSGLGRYDLALLAPLFAAIAWWSRGPRDFKRAAALASPILGVGALLGAWNYARFGNALALNYGMHNYAPYFQDAVQKYGFSSPRYIILHLYHGLFGAPGPSPEFPFFKYDDNGNGLFALSPLFLMLFGSELAPEAPRGAIRSAWLASVIVAIPVFLHFSTGWRQFGYRYALDFLPFLFFVLASLRFRIDRPLPIALIALAIWFHVCGVLQFVA